MKKAGKPKILAAGGLTADDILQFATGLSRRDFNRQTRRCDIIRFMLAQRGRLHITRRLAGGLGLRRRDLRAEITDWIDSPGPWRGHVHWAGRNRLVTDGTTGPQLLDLDGTQLALVFHALKLAQEAAASSIRQSNYTILLDRLAFALPRTQRQLLTLTVLTETPGLDSAKSADLAPVLGPVLAATRNWRRLNLRYRAADGAVTLRTVWPIILHYNDACLIAWCELRGEQRSFRLDRMLSAEVLPDAPLRARADLLAEWEDVRWQD